VNRPANDGGREPNTGEVIRILARFARLPLSDERCAALEAELATAVDEHDALRALPLELEPTVIFDPRWD
jgi:hypothetical protein